MSVVPENLKFTKDHEWLVDDGGNSFVIGITDHAQDSLGDVTFVELPEVGSSFSRGEVFGVVESVKAASDLYMPVGGEVLEINEELGDSPEKLNESPYDDGWIIKIKSSASEEMSFLLTADQYKEEIGKT
ncbi:MAG: glycine cleavage system protein H [Opitutae bacterium]|nr:glycine cleavage system protein H [Opitutae bacterium]|tara:strand:+ start:7983 stop:8372 length:390 start_codon:yes stop_codon:yes gene_type:complete